MGLLSVFKKSNKYKFSDEDRELSMDKRKLKLNKEIRSDKLDALSGIKDVVQVMADIDTAKNQLVQPYLESQPSEGSEDNEIIGLIKTVLQQNPNILAQNKIQPQPETVQDNPQSNVEIIASKIPEILKQGLRNGSISKKEYDKKSIEQSKKISDEVYEFILKN